MFKQFKKLFDNLEKKQKKNLIRNQVYVVISSLLEFSAIYSIYPVILIATDDNFTENKILFFLISFFDLENSRHILLYFSIFSIFLIIFSTILLVYVNKSLIKFSVEIGQSISNKIYINYLHQKFLEIKNRDQATYINNLVTECNRVAGGVINSYMQVVARCIYSFFLCLIVLSIGFLYNLLLLLFVSIFFILIYIIFRNTLKLEGKNLTIFNKQRVNFINESIKGIKEIIIRNIQKNFHNKMIQNSENLIKANTRVNLIQSLPRFGVEALIGISGILFILFIKHKNFDLILLLPDISVVIFALVKLFPSVNLVYQNFSIFKNNYQAFKNIEKDFLNTPAEKTESQNLEFKNHIALKNVSFAYSDKYILKNFNLNLVKNNVHIIFGPSGSGKSTILDIISGLIIPISGTINIDNQFLSEKVILSWFDKISYMSQNNFIFNESIFYNLTYGFSNNIDKPKIYNVLNDLGFDDNLDIFDKDIVGENGSKLSGGQKQRLLIARNILSDKEVLIFDEPTSSLDQNNVKKFINLIKKQQYSKTIIISSHDKNLINEFDNIYEIVKEV